VEGTYRVTCVSAFDPTKCTTATFKVVKMGKIAFDRFAQPTPEGYRGAVGWVSCLDIFIANSDESGVLTKPADPSRRAASVSLPPVD